MFSMCNIYSEVCQYVQYVFSSSTECDMCNYTFDRDVSKIKSVFHVQNFDSTNLKMLSYLLDCSSAVDKIMMIFVSSNAWHSCLNRREGNFHSFSFNPLFSGPKLSTTGINTLIQMCHFSPLDSLYWVNWHPHWFTHTHSSDDTFTLHCCFQLMGGSYWSGGNFVSMHGHSLFSVFCTSPIKKLHII